MTTRFYWDPVKAASNFRKHGVTFETAVRVFADPLATTKFDGVERGERRWRTVGKIDGIGLIFVAHTIWEEDEDGQGVEIIRIISARRATARERRRHEREDGEI